MFDFGFGLILGIWHLNFFGVSIWDKIVCFGCTSGLQTIACYLEYSSTFSVDNSLLIIGYLE